MLKTTRLELAVSYYRPAIVNICCLIIKLSAIPSSLLLHKQYAWPNTYDWVAISVEA